jgi:cell division protease FtsH
MLLYIYVLILLYVNKGLSWKTIHTSLKSSNNNEIYDNKKINIKKKSYSPFQKIEVKEIMTHENNKNYNKLQKIDVKEIIPNKKNKNYAPFQKKFDKKIKEEINNIFDNLLNNYDKPLIYDVNKEEINNIFDNLINNYDKPLIYDVNKKNDYNINKKLYNNNKKIYNNNTNDNNNIHNKIEQTFNNFTDNMENIINNYNIADYKNMTQLIEIEKKIKKVFGLTGGSDIEFIEKYEEPSSDANNFNKYYKNIFDGLGGNNQYNKKPKSGELDEDYIFDIIKIPTHTFSDIGGNYEIKKEIMQIIDSMVNSAMYEKYGLRQVKGVLLYGPPGNGKTLLVKGLCGEINMTLISASGSEFVETYVGVGAKRVRKIFETANENKPCIIFIDEIDALVRARGSTSHNEGDRTLNQLLVCLDGVRENKDIFLIGATNRIDILDPAFLRAGRVDKQIYMDNPDFETRQEIIKIHIKKKPYDNDVSILKITELTSGFSSAQIESLLNEAMLRALREKRYSISLNDIEFTINRILTGWKSKKTKFTNATLKKIAIHELGHAFVGLFSSDHKPLEKVVINLWSPSTPGFTKFIEGEHDIYMSTKIQLISKLSVLLAGRIAENYFYGSDGITTGAEEDYVRAKKLAETMILSHDMGNNHIYTSLSQKSKEFIDLEILKLIDIATSNAYNIIKECKDTINICADILLKNEILYPQEIYQVIQNNKPELLQNFKINL